MTAKLCCWFKISRAWRIHLHVTEVSSLSILNDQHLRVFCHEWPPLSRTKTVQMCRKGFIQDQPLLSERPGEKCDVVMEMQGRLKRTCISGSRAGMVSNDVIYLSSQAHCLICLILWDFPNTKCSFCSSLNDHICLLLIQINGGS